MCFALAVMKSPRVEVSMQILEAGRPGTTHLFDKCAPCDEFINRIGFLKIAISVSFLMFLI